MGMGLEKEAVAREIAKHLAHLFFFLGNKASAVEGILLAVQQYFHRRAGI